MYFLIEKEFGMQHTFEQPPEVVELLDKPDLASWMDQNTSRSWNYTLVPRFQGHDRAYVQLVRVITNFFESDSGSAYFWCGHLEGDIPRTKALLEVWLSTFENEIAKRNFLNIFQQDLHKLSLLLKAHPSLYWDMQFFILKSGHIVHMDVDRSFTLDREGKVIEKTWQGKKKAVEFQLKLDNFARLLVMLIQPGGEVGGIDE